MISSFLYICGILLIGTAPTAHGRVVGGDKVEPGTYPWFAGFEPAVSCGGTLIAPEFVLTAAHCGSHMEGKEVIIGEYKKGTTNKGAQKRKCETYIEHPDFAMDVGVINDYALCKLDAPVYIDDSVYELKLGREKDSPPSGTELLVVGFGAAPDISDDEENPNNPGTPQFLQDAEIDSITNDECIESFGNWFNSNGLDPDVWMSEDNVICAGGGPKDVCSGDSGGPLVARKDNGDGTFTDVHLGVVSYGPPCTENGTSGPGVYARTSGALDFIKKTVCDDYSSDAAFCGDEVGDDDKTDPCSDTSGYKFNGDSNKTCQGWAAKKTKSRCKKKDKNGNKVKNECPSVCDLRCSCKNSTKKIKVSGEGKLSCDKIEKRGLCDAKTKSGPVASKSCPKACKTCY